MGYDVVLIHPPAIYDFRKKPLFPGVLGHSVEHVQLVKVPLGMLSIADYLDRHGYKVLIDNLADRMVSSQAFDAETHIQDLSARIYAIDLHWHHHSQGAIEVARLCKKMHPDALVILGGLTATYFHQEIIHKYEFVDAVLRGEAEKPFLELVRALDSHGKLTATPNLTFRTDTGEMCATPLMEPSASLDEFEFTRFDLVEPQTSTGDSEKQPRGALVLCRGCVYNCLTCGGSAYSYRTYLGMQRPAFRSPGKIVEDIRRLNRQGIRFINLFQDPRMGGEAYWRELIAALGQDLDIDGLSMDLFAPADEEFIREVATLPTRVVLYICADSGADAVRRAQGRCYTNEDLLGTVQLCHKYHLLVTVFVSVGLAGETQETTRETWELCDKLYTLDQAALQRRSFDDTERSMLGAGPIIGPIHLDPGSLAFDFPERYGYHVLFGNLEEYRQALSAPSWHQWRNYETNLLNKDAILQLLFESIDYSINGREKYGFWDASHAAIERAQAQADRITVEEVDRVMGLQDSAERKARLQSMRASLDSFVQELNQDQ